MAIFLIFCIFLQSPHQVDWKNAVKCCRLFMVFYQSGNILCDKFDGVKNETYLNDRDCMLMPFIK